MSTSGSGRPILMIHGLGGQLHPHAAPADGREFGDGYRLIAMDRPGSGLFDASGRQGGSGQPGPLRQPLHGEARDRTRGCSSGHSLGGAIALRTAVDHPDKVAGLALLAPLTGKLAEVLPEFRPMLITLARICAA